MTFEPGSDGALQIVESQKNTGPVRLNDEIKEKTGYRDSEMQTGIQELEGTHWYSEHGKTRFYVDHGNVLAEPNTFTSPQEAIDQQQRDYDAVSDNTRDQSENVYISSGSNLSTTARGIRQAAESALGQPKTGEFAEVAQQNWNDLFSRRASEVYKAGQINTKGNWKKAGQTGNFFTLADRLNKMGQIVSFVGHDKMCGYIGPDGSFMYCPKTPENQAILKNHGFTGETTTFIDRGDSGVEAMIASIDSRYDEQTRPPARPIVRTFRPETEQEQQERVQRERKHQFTRSIVNAVRLHGDGAMVDSEVSDALKNRTGQYDIYFTEGHNPPYEDAYAFVARREQLGKLAWKYGHMSIALDQPTKFDLSDPPGKGEFGYLADKNTANEFATRIQAVGWFEPLGQSMYLYVDSHGDIKMCERNEENLKLLTEAKYKLVQKIADQEGEASILYPFITKGRQMQSGYGSVMEVWGRHAQTRVQSGELDKLRIQEQKLAKPKQ